MVEPKLCTLVLADEEVEVCNSAVQVYAKDAIFFREECPEIMDDFRLGEHRRYDDPRNPIDELIESIPGGGATRPLNRLVARQEKNELAPGA